VQKVPLQNEVFQRKFTVTKQGKKYDFSSLTGNERVVYAHFSAKKKPRSEEGGF
jgi:hypothetical protein